MAKGKGVLKTWFVDPAARRGSAVSSASVSSDSNNSVRDLQMEPKARPMMQTSVYSDKQGRLVEWIVDLLSEYVRKLIAKRRPRTGHFDPVSIDQEEGKMSLDEVAEVIVLPEFCKRTFKESVNYHKQVQIDEAIMVQLREYVATIASMYHRNAFHNFEHACHGKF